MVFDYDAVNGRLTAKQTLSTLPHGFAGTDFTSEVVIAADGRSSTPPTACTIASPTFPSDQRVPSL